MEFEFELITHTGETPLFQFQFWDEEKDAPLDLTGWSVYFGVGDFDGKLLLVKPMTVVNPEEGIVQVSLTSSETSQEGKFVVEIRGKKGNMVSVLTRGVIYIRRGIVP